MSETENQPQTRIDEVKEVIANSPTRIEEEFQRTANSWMECVGTRVFVIETYFASKKAEEELGSEKYASIINKIEALKNKLLELKQLYPDKTVPPDEVKQEIIQMLDVV